VIHFIKMTNNLLLVTADGLFAKRLSASLEREGYRLYVAKGKGEAVVRADEQNCSTAFLDLEPGEKFVSELGRALRTLNPTIKLLLIADEDTTPPALDELRPWALVRKPVRTPELLTMLKDTPTPAPLPKPIRATNESPAIHLAQQENQELPWLQDVTKAAQHLTRLTLESSAQAALITRRDTLWAYAGQLSQDAAKELAVTVTRHWDGQKGSDLLRFVRLEATKAEHMLYATRLAEDVVLALVFDAETPFSTIRMQAGQLVNMLSTTPAIETAEQHQPAQQPVVKPQQAPAAHEAPTQYVEEDESNQELDIPDISSILNDVPPHTPSPDTNPLRDSWTTSPSHSRPRKVSRES
jgi:CheY-like chemotaxis protein